MFQFVVISEPWQLRSNQIIFMPLQVMLHHRHFLCFCLVHLMPNILLSPCKNAEWLSMKFVEFNHYHEQMNKLNDYTLGKIGTGRREQDTTQYSKQCLSVL